MAEDTITRKAVNALHREVRELRRDLDEVKRLVRKLSGLSEKEIEITWGKKKGVGDD